MKRKKEVCIFGFFENYGYLLVNRELLHFVVYRKKKKKKSCSNSKDDTSPVFLVILFPLFN
jgi:hypothetical protein